MCVRKKKSPCRILGETQFFWPFLENLSFGNSTYPLFVLLADQIQRHQEFSTMHSRWKILCLVWCGVFWSNWVGKISNEWKKNHWSRNFCHKDTKSRRKYQWTFTAHLLWLNDNLSKTEVRKTFPRTSQEKKTRRPTTEPHSQNNWRSEIGTFVQSVQMKKAECENHKQHQPGGCHKTPWLIKNCRKKTWLSFLFCRSWWWFCKLQNIFSVLPLLWGRVSQKKALNLCN